jgi:hypothetical protein
VKNNNHIGEHLGPTDVDQVFGGEPASQNVAPP